MSTKTDDLRARLEEDQRIIDAATGGPWEVLKERVVTEDMDLVTPRLHCAPDAEFIATSRTRWEQANRALLAVLELHKPVRRYLPYDGAGASFATEREALEASQDEDLSMWVMEDLSKNGAPYFDLCVECKRIEDGPCDGDCTAELGYLTSLWPCPTVKAIQEAMG